MYGYILQDWVTIRGNSTITTIVQGESAWLGLAAFQDIVLWLDVREFTLGGASSLVMNYETAPTKDETLFTSMVPAQALALTPPPIITKVLLAQNPAVPLGRWVRWRLSVSGGSVTQTWDATFRVLASCNAAATVPGQ